MAKQPEWTLKDKALDQIGEAIDCAPGSSLRAELRTLPVAALHELYKAISDEVGEAEMRGMRFGEKHPRKVSKTPTPPPK